MSSHKAFAVVPKGVEGVNPDHPLTRRMHILDAAAGLVERTRDKVAFCGYATSSRDLAPFDDPEYDIVGLNQLYRMIPRADFWFDIHLNWDEDNVEGTDHAGWLEKCGIPVFMASPPPQLPTGVRFPLGPCIQIGADYFTSTVSYMIAWGIHQGYKEISLYGIDLIVGTEYECVVPDTRVLTADLRWVPAGRLSVGDRLVGFDEYRALGTGGRRYRTAVVTGSDRIERECSRVTLADGTTMVVSSDHPWLTKSGSKFRWRKTDELDGRHHRRPSRLVKLVDVWGQPVHSWDAGYLAAAFDGEGHISGTATARLGRCGGVAFSQRENQMASTVQRALDTYGFRTRCDSQRGSGVSTWTVAGGRPETMRFLGQMRPQRLLQSFEPDLLGRVHTKEAVPVVSVEPVGIQEVVALGTSTKTFIAEGFATHNTQKACVEFWLGIAHGRGITVRLPENCALCKTTHRYGYEKEPDWNPVKLSDYQARIKSLTSERDKLLSKLHALDGAMHEVKTREKWTEDPAVREEWLQKQHQETMAMLSTIDGALQEAAHWQELATLRSRGADIQVR